MVEEHLEGDVVGKYDVARGRALVIIRGGGVELGEEEARLRPVLVAVHHARYGEAVVHNHLGVRLRPLQQLREGGVLRLVVVLRLAPLRHRGAVEDDHREVRVQEEDAVRGDGCDVQQCGLGRAVKGIGEEGGLDHNERVEHILAVEHHAVVGRLVGRVSKHLHELAPPQVEHELRVDGELRGELEALRVVLAVFPKFAPEADEGAVQPPGGIELLLNLHLPAGKARHHHRRRLLVEPRDQVRLVLPVRPPPCDGGHPHAHLPVLQLPPAQELQEELLLRLLPLLRRLRRVGRHLEVHRHGGGGVQPAHLPARRAPQPHLRVRHGLGLLLEGRAGPDDARHLDVPAAHHLKHPVAREPERALLAPLDQQPLEALLKHGVQEALREHHHPARALDRTLHLREPNLVERAREHVQGVPVPH
mmetsp:Transcript_54019/g.171417  ORF Transcript_54019/g.171417 Transcript_54019/m.171417 type:complete len:419 (+) Transcript_54019:152-1408(+)